MEGGLIVCPGGLGGKRKFCLLLPNMKTLTMADLCLDAIYLAHLGWNALLPPLPNSALSAAAYRLQPFSTA